MMLKKTPNEKARNHTSHTSNMANSYNKNNKNTNENNKFTDYILFKTMAKCFFRNCFSLCSIAALCAQHCSVLTQAIQADLYNVYKY